MSEYLRICRANLIYLGSALSSQAQMLGLTVFLTFRTPAGVILGSVKKVKVNDIKTIRVGRIGSVNFLFISYLINRKTISCTNNGLAFILL